MFYGKKTFILCLTQLGLCLAGKEHLCFTSMWWGCGAEVGFVLGHEEVVRFLLKNKTKNKSCWINMTSGAIKLILFFPN